MEADIILQGTGSFGYCNLQNIIDAAKEKFGKDCDLSKIGVEVTEEQFQCFGYDQYDSADYKVVMNFFLE